MEKDQNGVNQSDTHGGNLKHDPLIKVRHTYVPNFDHVDFGSTKLIN